MWSSHTGGEERVGARCPISLRGFFCVPLKERGLRRAFSKSALSRKMNMPPVTVLESGQSRAAQRRVPSFSEPMQYLLPQVAVA